MASVWVGSGFEAEAGQPGRALAVSCALAVLLLAASLRFWALDFGAPHTLVRPDETPVLEFSLKPTRGEFDLGWSIYPHAYVYGLWLWGEGVARAGAVVGAWSEESHATTFQLERPRAFVIARSSSAVAGLATVVLLLLVARRSLGDTAGLVAAILLATSFLHVRDSHAAKPDVLLGLCVFAALAASAPLAERATAARGALAGAAIGLAMGAKYPGVLLLVPATVAAYMGSSARGWRRIVPGAPALAAGAAAALVFLVTSPYLVLNRDTLLQVFGIAGAAFPGLLPGLADSLPGLPAKGLEGPPPSEYAPATWWGGLVYHARFSLWFGAGMLPTLLAPFALVWGFASRRALPVVCAVFVAVYFSVMSLSPALLARYMTPLLPPLLLLEAGLLVAIATRLAPRRVATLALAMTAVVAAEPLYAAIAHDRILGRTDTRVEATEWMEAHLPPDARIAMYGKRFWVWGQPTLPVGRTRVPAEPDASSFEDAAVGFWLTHDHPLFWSSVDPEVQARLAPRLRLLAEFLPYDPGRAHPVFESADAYYAPFAGFAHVERAGPAVRIYAFE